MTASYTGEAKFPLQDNGGGNWGAVQNGMLADVDAGDWLRFTAGEAITAFSAVYLKSDGKIYLADADDIAKLPVVGIAPYAITIAEEGRILRSGWVDYDDTDYTALAADENDVVYVSGTAGELTTAMPSGTAQVFGYAKTVTADHITRIVFNLRPAVEMYQWPAFILKTALTAGSTVAIFSSNAPFKFRVLDAWSVAKSTDAGTVKITDGTDDITDAWAVTATDKTINRAGTIDDAKYEIAAAGSLSVVGDGSLADVEVYVSCIRVA